MNTFNYYLYKKRINKIFKINFLFVLILMFLFISLSVFFKPTQIKSYFYFIEIDNFATYSNALNLANEIKNKNGAGYIFYEKNYKVLATFFTNKKDAEKVASNLKEMYSNSKVFTLKVSKNLKLFSFTKKQKEIVEKLKNETSKTISFLSSSSILLDTQELSFNKFNYKQTEALKQFNSCYEKFSNSFKQNSVYNSAKKYLNNIKMSFTGLNEIDNISQLSLNLKFHLVDIVINYVSFLNCFT